MHLYSAIQKPWPNFISSAQQLTGFCNTGTSTLKVITTTQIFYTYALMLLWFRYLPLTKIHASLRTFIVSFVHAFVSRERFPEHYSKLNTYPKSSTLSWSWIQNPLLIHFQVTCLFLQPLKTPKNKRFFDDFRGCRKRPMTWINSLVIR